MSAERKIAAAVLAGAVALGGIGYAVTRGQGEPQPVGTQKPSAAAASPTPRETSTVPTLTLTPRTPEPTPSPTLKAFDTIMVENPPTTSVGDVKTAIQNAFDSAYKNPQTENIWPLVGATRQAQNCELGTVSAQVRGDCLFVISKLWEIYQKTGDTNAYTASKLTYNFGATVGPWKGNKVLLDQDLKLRIPQDQFKS